MHTAAATSAVDGRPLAPASHPQGGAERRPWTTRRDCTHGGWVGAPNCRPRPLTPLPMHPTHLTAPRMRGVAGCMDRSDATALNPATAQVCVCVCGGRKQPPPPHLSAAMRAATSASPRTTREASSQCLGVSHDMAAMSTCRAQRSARLQLYYCQCWPNDDGDCDCHTHWARTLAPSKHQIIRCSCRPLQCYC